MGDNETLEASIVELANVINRSYSIPFFQRKYEWSAALCTNLFTDLMAAFRAGDSKFLGPIVVLRLEDARGRDQIVDGQQRLTSISLLVRVIRDRFADIYEERVAANAEPELEEYDHISRLIQFLEIRESVPGRAQDRVTKRIKYENVSLNAHFEFVMDEDIRETRNTVRIIEPRRILVRNYRKFNLHIGTWLEGQEHHLALLEQLAKYLLNRVQFCLITTRSLYYAVAVFAGLNSRGQPLEDIDIVKSIALQQLTNDATKVQWCSDFEEHVRRYRSNKSRHLSDSKSGKHFLQNVRAWIVVRGGNSTVRNRRSLTESFERDIVPHLAQNDGREEVAQVPQLLLNHCHTFVSQIGLLATSHPTWRWMHVHLKTLENASWEPVLACLHQLFYNKWSAGNSEDRGRIVETAEGVWRFVAVLMIGTPADLSQRLYEMLAKLRGLETTVDMDPTLNLCIEVDKWVGELTRDTDKYACVELISSSSLAGTITNVKRQDVIRFLLLTYDRSLRALDDVAVEYDSNVHVEHIVARKPNTWSYNCENDGWGEEHRDALVCGLGNLTLLGVALNGKMSNKKYRDKILRMNDEVASTAVTRNLHESYPNAFSPTDCTERWRSLCTALFNRLQIEERFWPAVFSEGDIVAIDPPVARPSQRQRLR